MRCLVGIAALASCHSDAPTVAFRVFGEPTLFEYRDGSSWSTPSYTLDGYARVYAVPAMPEYEIVLVCPGANGAMVSRELRAVDADVEIAALGWPDWSCYGTSGGSGEAPPVVPVSGQMQQAGSVLMGMSYATGTNTPWPFHVKGTLGDNDLIAWSDDRVVIRHDRRLSVTAPFAEPQIDLGSEGSDWTTIQPVVVGATPDEDPSFSFDLLTKNGSFDTWAAADLPPAVSIVPPSQLDPLDGEWLVVSVTSRLVEFRVTADTPAPSTFELLPPLTGVELSTTDVAATWQAPAIYTDVEVGYGNSSTAQAVTATRGWLEAHGDGVSFDADIDGFLADWLVDPATADRDVTVKEHTPTSYRVTCTGCPTATGSAFSASLVTPSSPGRSRVRWRPASIARPATLPPERW
jgi:hypothetical protein